MYLYDTFFDITAEKTIKVLKDKLCAKEKEVAQLVKENEDLKVEYAKLNKKYNKKKKEVKGKSHSSNDDISGPLKKSTFDYSLRSWIGEASVVALLGIKDLRSLVSSWTSRNQV